MNGKDNFLNDNEQPVVVYQQIKNTATRIFRQ